jgi:hypothetical protein
MRLNWKDGVSTPFVGAAAALQAPRASCRPQRPSVLEAPAGAARRCDTHEVSCQDWAAQR